MDFSNGSHFWFTATPPGVKWIHPVCHFGLVAQLLSTRGSKDRHGTHTGPGVFRVARLWCVWEKLAEKVAPEQYIVGKRIAPEEKKPQNTIS